MTTGNVERRATGSIRETYEEFELGGTSVAMIADPENEHAWIQSNVTLAVRR